MATKNTDKYNKKRWAIPRKRASSYAEERKLKVHKYGPKEGTDVRGKIKDLTDNTFRVEYNGENYTGTKNKIQLPKEGKAKFTVKGVESYKVSLLPNVTDETDFTYIVDGNTYHFSNTDLSSLFFNDDSIKDGSFYLNCFYDYSLENLLSLKYDGTEIELSGSLKYPYVLTFTSGNNEVSFLFEVEQDDDKSNDEEETESDKETGKSESGDYGVIYRHSIYNLASCLLICRQYFCIYLCGLLYLSLSSFYIGSE